MKYCYTCLACRNTFDQDILIYPYIECPFCDSTNIREDYPIKEPDENNTGKYKWFLNDIPLATSSLFTVELKSDFEYYMRRGNKFYFRNSLYKIVLESDPPSKELLALKYGTEVNIKWEDK